MEKFPLEILYIFICMFQVQHTFVNVKGHLTVYLLHWLVLKYELLIFPFIQNVPGGKVNILGGHSIGHSK
jgi:hypothetical protein